MPALLMVTTIPATLRAFLLPFADHFRALGWRVEAAAAGIEEVPALREHFDACHALPLSRNPLSGDLLRAPAAIRRLVAAGAYDIVHVHTPIAAFLVRFALRGRPVKVVYTAHGFHFHPHGQAAKNAVFRRLEAMAAHWCDAIITINRTDYEAARRFGGPRVLYVPGIGIDLEAWAPGLVSAAEEEQARQSLALPAGAIPFLMVAEFNPGKRHADAIEAVAQLQDPRIHLLLAGAGPGLDEARKLAEDWGVGAQVHFLGFRRDIPALIRLSRAVLLPSAREGLPRSLLEAMALERAVITSDVRGCAELGEAGGLVHALGHPGELAEALRRLADAPALAKQKGQAGRARLLEGGYDIRAILAAHETLYRELLC